MLQHYEFRVDSGNFFAKEVWKKNLLKFDCSFTFIALKRQNLRKAVTITTKAYTTLCLFHLEHGKSYNFRNKVGIINYQCDCICPREEKSVGEKEKENCDVTRLSLEWKSEYWILITKLCRNPMVTKIQIQTRLDQI